MGDSIELTYDKNGNRVDAKKLFEKYDSRIFQEIREDT